MNRILALALVLIGIATTAWPQIASATTTASTTSTLDQHPKPAIRRHLKTAQRVPSESGKFVYEFSTHGSTGSDNLTTGRGLPVPPENLIRLNFMRRFVRNDGEGPCWPIGSSAMKLQRNRTVAGDRLPALTCINGPAMRAHAWLAPRLPAPRDILAGPLAPAMSPQ